MLGAGANIGITSFKWGIKITYAFAMTAFFIVFLGLAISSVNVLLNDSIVLDLLYLIQMWLPFNINPMFSWLFMATTAYFAFRLSAIGYSILHRALA